MFRILIASGRHVHLYTTDATYMNLQLGRMSELRSSSTGEVRNKSAVSVLLLAVCIILALTLAWMGRVILLLLFAAIVLASLLSAIID